MFLRGNHSDFCWQYSLSSIWLLNNMEKKIMCTKVFEKFLYFVFWKIVHVLILIQSNI